MVGFPSMPQMVFSVGLDFLDQSFERGRDLGSLNREPGVVEREFLLEFMHPFRELSPRLFIARIAPPNSVRHLDPLENRLKRPGILLSLSITGRRQL
jgi:hypothetical protein